MKMEEMNVMQYPVICTRDVVVFPGEEVSIEVGREMSLNALRRANESFNSEIFFAPFTKVSNSPL